MTKTVYPSVPLCRGKACRKNKAKSKAKRARKAAKKAKAAVRNSLLKRIKKQIAAERKRNRALKKVRLP